MNVSNIYVLKDVYGAKLTTGNSFLSAYEKAVATPKCTSIEKNNVEENKLNSSSTVWKNNHFDCYI